MEKIKKINKLAYDVIILSRNILLVNLRFLDAALNQFEYVSYKETAIGTDGKHFFFNPHYVLKNYKEEKERITRDYLHVLLHCIFRHMYGAYNLNRSIWNLACDIAVEYTIVGLGLNSVTSKREESEVKYFEELEKKVKLLTAEKIYRYYRDKHISSSEIEKIRQIFFADNHTIWYERKEEDSENIQNNGGDNSKNKLGGNKNKPDDESNSESSSNLDSDIKQDNNQTEEGSQTSVMEQEQIWKDLSQKIQTDLETFAKEKGDTAGGLIQNLNAVNREKYDYINFLRKFTTLGEAMKINDDEFDYIFYTYGLKLYDKMPLIEPLEYKEVKRIKEFVIAIDTSGSVMGKQVQSFIQKTYNILKSTESFFSKINLHIIQCDAKIQEHVKITTQEEFDNYIKTLEIHGLGGTDFRPVFQKVDELIKNHEFTNLKGLIYFTDGYGDFPEKKPNYDTAFVFVKDDYEIPKVPSWAIKLILQKEELSE